MSKGTVLVVDDDESILEFVETALKLEGYDVVVASTAIDRSNEEIDQAYFNRVPVIPRAEMLAELMRFVGLGALIRLLFLPQDTRSG